MSRPIKIYILALFLIFCQAKLWAQELTGELSEQEFLELVQENHPVAKQARNMAEMGEYAILEARGAFDPYLFSKNKQKFYKDTNYYLYSNSGISLPTRTGITFQGGYDWNEGEYISRENSLPANGLWYAGVSVPVLQGLFIDERRAAFQQALVERRNFENEARLMLNDVFLQATSYYWQWVQFKAQKQVVEAAIELASDNLQNFKIAFQQGDKPAIDTLEASIQLQNLQIQNQQLQNDLETARLNLYNFLWGEEVNPVEESPINPPQVDRVSMDHIDSLRASMQIFVQDHPALRAYDLKLKMLQIENRLKREKLKPKLNLEYNVIQDPANDISEVTGLDNYKWGVSFSMPLLLRSERGALRMNELKLENTNYQYQQKRLEILNKARQYENTFENISKQLNTYQQVVTQYEQLLKAELRKFNIGESSIFLINYRQMSLVNARLKFIELQSKYRYYYRQWLHSLGAAPDLWLRE
ncbi:transporter [Marivirga lumbricoides]|uniref:Transporter n=2 Tax=Marivirga lumbricoides TaxID=1046115 RepID=A0ABQ1N2X3_9BACT|nr:transporter [Marivirga lumbricoides]